MNSDPSRPVHGVMHTSFLVVSSVLLLSAVAFNGFVWNLKLHFKKEAVPQPREFKEIPTLMGHWLQVSADDKLDKETEDVLGTKEYLYRDYIQVDRAGADLVEMLAERSDFSGTTTRPSEPDVDQMRAGQNARAAFTAAAFDKQVEMITNALKGKTPRERQTIGTELEMNNHSGDMIHLGLTYYTGLVDTVAHIPDRCYIADGYEPTSYTVPTWQLGNDASGKPISLQVRFISFQDTTGNNRVSKCVAYVFHANGEYDSDPLGVRAKLEDLTQKYGYYAKIELMTLVPKTMATDNDIASSTQAMSDFLTAARPEIEACFPNWNKVEHGH
jgi:hypothetical protein